MGVQGLLVAVVAVLVMRLATVVLVEIVFTEEAAEVEAAGLVLVLGLAAGVFLAVLVEEALQRAPPLDLEAHPCLVVMEAMVQQEPTQLQQVQSPVAVGVDL